MVPQSKFIHRGGLRSELKDAGLLISSGSWAGQSDSGTADPKWFFMGICILKGANQVYRTPAGPESYPSPPRMGVILFVNLCGLVKLKGTRLYSSSIQFSGLFARSARCQGCVRRDAAWGFPIFEPGFIRGPMHRTGCPRLPVSAGCYSLLAAHGVFSDRGYSQKGSIATDRRGNKGSRGTSNSTGKRTGYFSPSRQQGKPSAGSRYDI